jgi:hypothetical protein
VDSSGSELFPLFVPDCLGSFSSSDPSLNYVMIRKATCLHAENDVALNLNIVLYKRDVLQVEVICCKSRET